MGDKAPKMEPFVDTPWCVSYSSIPGSRNQLEEPTHRRKGK